MWRSGSAVLAAAAAVATAFVVTSSAANAATISSACDARAVGVNAPSPLSVARANPQSSPCAFDEVALADASVTIIPGVPLVSGASANVHAIKSTTSFATVAGFASTEAQTDVARLQVLAPGLLLQATGVHSQAGVSINPFCGGAAVGDSWLASLTVNGKVFAVGNKPLTIKVGLRIVISLNQTVRPNAHEITQRTLSITFPDHRYSLVVGESHAKLACVATP